MPSMVYFRKNCETMLLFIKANIMFNFYCNATIIIIGTRSAGMDVLYHQNFFLEVYRLMTDETIHFQHSYYYVMKVVNKLSSRIWLFSSDVKVDSFWSLSWTFTKCEKSPHTFLCNSFSFFPCISCKNICHSFAEVFISEISLTIVYFVQILYLCFKTLFFCFLKKYVINWLALIYIITIVKWSYSISLIHRMRKSMNATQNLYWCVLLKVIHK